MTVDPLRRQAGARRSSRSWDRGQWFCCLLFAVLCLAIGLWSASTTGLGQVVGSTVHSCDTELQPWGRFLRHVTECRVTTEDVDGHHTTLRVETSRPHPADTRLSLIAFRGTYADADLTSN